MENQLPVGERDLADNSENFALVNEIIPTADTYNIENIVTTTTAKAALGAHKESVAEGFSDSLFAKLLGVGHRFSSDIQGTKIDYNVYKKSLSSNIFFKKRNNIYLIRKA